MSTVPGTCSVGHRETLAIGECGAAVLSKVWKGQNQSAFALPPGGIKTSFRSLKDPPRLGPPLMT
jgi:hypothetical protein